jgi:hypothetical protein
MIIYLMDFDHHFFYQIFHHFFFIAKNVPYILKLLHEEYDINFVKDINLII